MLVFGIVRCCDSFALLGDNGADALELVCDAVCFCALLGGDFILFEIVLNSLCGCIGRGAFCKEGFNFFVRQAWHDDAFCNRFGGNRFGSNRRGVGRFSFDFFFNFDFCLWCRFGCNSLLDSLVNGRCFGFCYDAGFWGCEAYLYFQAFRVWCFCLNGFSIGCCLICRLCCFLDGGFGDGVCHVFDSVGGNEGCGLLWCALGGEDDTALVFACFYVARNLALCDAGQHLCVWLDRFSAEIAIVGRKIAKILCDGFHRAKGIIESLKVA